MSATVIDALVVTLGLDPKGFKKGSEEAQKQVEKTKQETTRAAKEIEYRGQQAADAFGKLKKEALAILGIFTAGMGIKNFTQSTIGSAANIGFLADNLKMSTTRLDAWGRAAERAGGSYNGMVGQLKESANEASLFKMGQTSEAQQWFFRMGGDPKALRDGNSFLIERSRIIARLYKSDPAMAANVARNMGISEENFNLLKQGTAAIEALVAAQEKNSRFTRQQSADALELKNKWLDLKEGFEKTGTSILLRLFPIFQRLTGKLLELAGWTDAHKDDIYKWVDRSVTAIERFITWANKAADSVGGWKNIIIALIGLKVGSGLINLVATIGGLATNLGLAGGKARALIGILTRLAPWAILAEDFINPKAAGGGKDEKQFEGSMQDQIDRRNLDAFVKAGGTKEDWLKQESAKASAGDRPKVSDAIKSGSVHDLKAGALADFIAKGEGSYNRVNLGQAGGYKASTADLEDMTIGEVLRHQNNKDFMAAGRYQMMPSTILAGMKSLGLSSTEKFNKKTQDKLFNEYLMQVKRPKIQAYLSGKSDDLHGALKELSMEFASVADPDSGKSYYAGQGNNHASISAAQASRALIAERGRLAGGMAGDDSNVGNNNHVETTFNGPINIITQATDAKGIAADFSRETSTLLSAQANTGLN